MPAPYRGGCQCGAYRFEITAEPLTAYVCHCSDCQKQSGSAFGMAVVVAKDALRVLQGDTASYRKTAASGREADCLFCPGCGNRLFHAGGGPVLMIKTGLLDDTTGLEPVCHLWVKDKQPWVQIPPDVLTYETQPSDGFGALIERYKARTARA